MTKEVRAALALAVVVIVAVAAVGGGTAASQQRSTVTIGWAYDGIGQMSPFDGPALATAKTRVAQVNRTSNIRLRLITCNTQNNKPAIAKACATKLLSQGADVIMTTCDVDLAAPVVQTAINAGKLTVAACIGTDQMGPKRFGAKGRLAFSYGNVAQDEGSAMAEYAWKRGWRTASLATDTVIAVVMQAVTEHFAGSGFKVFAGMIANDPKVEVWAIPAPTGGSRAFCDRMNSWAQGEGQPGLGYVFWRDGEEGGAGPIAKNIGPERTEAIRQQMDLKTGDACFFVAGRPEKFVKFAGDARTRVGKELSLTNEDEFALAWIVDFPFYEWDDEEKRVDFAHNPFSMPQGGIDALNSQDPLTIKAFQYDCVCNGYEIASGSIRNHSPDTMVKAFELTGKSKAEVEEKFGGMYRAFQYGAPPHGGMAFGVDRIVMLVVGASNLREITLFPMNQQAQDLLMGAPSDATPKQLRELHIRLNLPET